jgi:predicted nucleotidyltransferase
MKAGIATRRALRQGAGMSKRELVAKHRDAILALAAKHGATDVRIFGSVARGDDDETSDVDFLATFSGAQGWDVFAQQYDFQEELSRLLACKTHVLREHRHIRPRLRANIERDLVPL